MPTLPYTWLDVQWADTPLAFVFGLVFYVALAAVLFSGLEHTPALTILPGHSQAALAAPHLLTAGGPPPSGTCGGGASTHC